MMVNVIRILNTNIFITFNLLDINPTFETFDSGANTTDIPDNIMAGERQFYTTTFNYINNLK